MISMTLPITPKDYSSKLVNFLRLKSFHKRIPTGILGHVIPGIFDIFERVPGPPEYFFEMSLSLKMLRRV